MSLSRSSIASRKEFDPYDDEPAEKPPPKKAARRSVKKQKPKPNVPETQNKPKLKDKPDTIVEIVDRYALANEDVGSGNGKTEVSVLKVHSELGIVTDPEAYAFVKKDIKAELKIGWKSGDRQDDAAKGVPLLRFMEAEEKCYESTRQWLDDDYFLMKMDAEGPQRVITLAPATKWFNLMPYLEDATHHMSADKIYQAMSNRSHSSLGLSAALKDVTLSASELRIFRNFCKNSKYDMVNRTGFTHAWDRAKSQPPPPQLLSALFGNSIMNDMSLDEVMLKLQQLGTSGMSAEELEQRRRRAAEKEEDEEQDLEEVVEGVEREFDDDIEDKPELDPDHAGMDMATKDWGNENIEASTENKGVNDDRAVVGLEDELAEAVEGDEQAVDLDGEDGDDDGEKSGGDEDDTEAPKKPAKKAPPKAPSKPTPKAGQKRAQQPSKEKEPPKKKPRVTKAQQLLDSEIDAALAKLSKKADTRPFTESLQTIEKKTIKSLTAYAQRKAEGEKKARTGAVARPSEYLRPFVDQYKQAIHARIVALGGTVDGGDVTIP